ncbi:uncharacterized protein VDAG_10094 [Verticillium dahliae VdLs.17]|uniref:DUF7820 domain-containing protein n=1 Tax=Verticillium dahliae (strain VdLs.17 / ATCC MYA-4575 / FGSC 10137) TaxID=498257 RepID=G2XIX1_VERDV|nr:uncharacterized protein VDAG_10094 [Verticillium dahliae VdLs.17]EGY20465.1 hypothetical protein VDAG_10094 [Verticillium dahliae VdLs.17]
MDSSPHRQPGVGPADSATTSVRTSISSRLDSDDDYDLSAMMIADGFRPSDSLPMSTQPPSTSLARDPNQPLHLASSASSVSTHAPEASFAPPSARPSSIAKPPRTHDPLALRHDGALGHLNAARLSRTPSSSTAIPSEYSESTINGSSGSSTAHHAYPQRTFSVATSSTMPISERSYAGPQRPTHPYGLYTQTTAPVDAPHDSDIPVGFGRPDNYRRRIGPDGEEIADMIGPLGHTEELPPYSRYPDEAYARKTTGSNEQETDADATPQQPVSNPPIPGAGGIGLATRNPEFESRDDLDTPQSRLSTRSVTSDSVSQHEINTAAQTFNEKDDHRWQKRAKKRMWGVVPYWAVCLVAVALLVMGIILGAVIGTLFAKEDSNKPDYTLQLTLSNGSSISGLYNWGTQPPTIDDPIIMRLVKDNDAPELGPAWFAQVAYNKTVIIAEDRFPNVGSMSSKNTVKRNWGLEPPTDLKGKGVIGTNAGDRPWICTWPGTLLEVFIYPSENNSFSGSPSPSTSSDATTSTAPTSSTNEQPAAAPYGPPTTTTRTPKPPAPPYPKIMKIEESRISDDDTRAAVCQQVEICDDGFTSVPVIGVDGDPIQVIIVENQRLVAYHFEESKRSVRDNSLRPRNSQPYSQLSECGCMWWFT